MVATRFHDGLPLVTPPVWRGDPLTGHDRALLVATSPDVRRLVRRQGMAQDAGVPLFTSRFYAERPPCAVVGPFIGAPHAVMLLETISAWGIRRLVLFGWCGAVHHDLTPGDLLIPSSAIPDEGTSRHYSDATDAWTPSAGINRFLFESLSAHGLTTHQGPVWSTDAIFRETPGKIAAFREKGAVAVDMELSAVLAAGAALGVEVGAVLLVSDDVSGPRWRPGFSTDRFRRARNAVTTALMQLWETPWTPKSETERKHSADS
ncbi:MAG: nucleoside phosphorylase [Desulfobacterales bacterium]